jgi:hypothetical protein
VTLEKTSESVKNLLERHNQGHILDFWGQLDGSQRRRLLAQIEAVDFSRIDQWISDFIKGPVSAKLPEEFSAAPSYAAVASPAQEEEQTHLSSAIRQIALILLTNFY